MIEANRALPKQRTRLSSLIQQKEYLALGVMLFITILNGLIFTFIVPPWQHYDEPTNFEYAWLIANKPGLPNPGDYDTAMRRQVAASMIENGFYAKGSEPDLDAMEDPVWIGTSQLEDRPFTYWLFSLPLRLFRSRSVTNQLYLGRLVSIIFYVRYGDFCLGNHAGTNFKRKPITMGISYCTGYHAQFKQFDDLLE
jgi:hypothetical protein